MMLVSALSKVGAGLPSEHSICGSRPPIAQGGVGHRCSDRLNVMLGPYWLYRPASHYYQCGGVSFVDILPTFGDYDWLSLP